MQSQSQPYSQLDDLVKDLGKLESSMSALNLQQRLTSLEEITKVNARDVDKLVSWQEKFQWALIALLAESIWRLYDQFKSKGR
jgi:UV DNA damage repair endonuclease